MGALAPGDIFLFEGFHLDRRGLFRRDQRGILVPEAVGARALDVLGVLIERPGDIVSRDDIMAAVWPGTAVENGNLTVQISALRQILDRGRAEGSCIQNVARRGYRLTAAVTRVEAEVRSGTTAISPSGASPLPRLSIVVLPFTNLSSDPEQEYFADSITDDLTTDLSRISGSFVIACSTAFAYKGKSVDVKQVGRELGVRYVLEGSVRRSGSQVRMNVQLIDAETGGHLWVERFETDRRDLAEAEDEITGRLARTLNLELVEAVGRRIEQERAIDLDAHDLVMRGWAWFYRPRSGATLQDAQDAFERALELDPQSVEARIGLATVLVTMILEGWSKSLPRDQERAEQLLAEVFARGTNHAMAHHAMGMLRRSQNRLTEARIEAERAVTLDHNNSAALYELGLVFMYLGDPEAAIPHIEKAIRLSPRDPRVSAMQYGLGRCHLLLGHLDQATELFDRVRAASSRYSDVHLWLAGPLGLEGDLDGTSAELAEAKQHAPERRFDEPFPVAAEEVTSIGVRVRQRLWEHMARECGAMAQHALSTGRIVPLEVLERLDQGLCSPDAPAAAAPRGRRSSDRTPREEPTVRSAPVVEMSPLASLSVAHVALAQIIAPATPEAVLLLADERATHPLWYALGPLPIVRQMLGLAILSVFVLLGIALSEEINVVKLGATMLTLVGYSLLVKEAYLVSAASLGSCFQNLQKINVVISDGTYDPKFQSTYWTRWVMGVVSGLILSQLIYVFLMKAPTTEASAVPATIGQPLLALLGGYSSDLVQGLLSHTIDTVAGFFRVSGDAAVDNQARTRVTGRDAGEAHHGLRSVRPAA